MKRIHIVIMIALVVLGVSLFNIIGQEKGTASQAMTQEEIVDNLTERLIQQGVPIKSAKITSDASFGTIIEFVLQSSSEGDRVAPDDPLYEHAVRREVDLAQERGLKVKAVKVTFVNTQGKLICGGTVVTKEGMISQFDTPSKLDNDTVVDLLRQELDLCGMSLDKLDVSLDPGGIRWATVHLQVPDIETANAGIPDFMWKIRNTVEALNANQGTQIAIYQVNLTTTQGEPLLRYVNDLQLEREHWWQADELTKEWFPHPPAE